MVSVTISASLPTHTHSSHRQSPRNRSPRVKSALDAPVGSYESPRGTGAGFGFGADDKRAKSPIKNKSAKSPSNNEPNDEDDLEAVRLDDLDCGGCGVDDGSGCITTVTIMSFYFYVFLGFFVFLFF